MRARHLMFALALSAHLFCGEARADPIPVPAKRQLVGLTSSEAATLLAKMAEAQRQLRAGKFQSFVLLGGSVASYDQADLPPRTMFLRIPFEQVWNIQRLTNATPFTQSFNLDYAPDGLGKPYWEIRVVLDSNAAPAQVTMTFKPPAPF